VVAKSRSAMMIGNDFFILYLFIGRTPVLWCCYTMIAKRQGYAYLFKYSKRLPSLQMSLLPKGRVLG
jgi:hypothetical protein